MRRSLIYRPAAQRALKRLEGSDATRILRSLEEFAASGRGDIKALKGLFRLRVGKWRVFFRLDQPTEVVVVDIDNRGEAY